MTRTRRSSWNPAALVRSRPGNAFTSAAYYSDYRYARHPQENFGFGRDFVVKERYRLSLRAEFTNIFNRANVPNPTSVNALAKQTTNPTTGTGTAGFGWVNTQTRGRNVADLTRHSRRPLHVLDRGAGPGRPCFRAHGSRSTKLR